MNHHPDIEIRLTKVPLKLTTHDEGGITKKVSPVPGDAMRCFPGLCVSGSTPIRS